MTTSTLLGGFILFSSTSIHRDHLWRHIHLHIRQSSQLLKPQTERERNWSQAALEEFKNPIVSTVIG